MFPQATITFKVDMCRKHGMLSSHDVLISHLSQHEVEGLVVMALLLAITAAKQVTGAQVKPLDIFSGHLDPFHAWVYHPKQVLVAKPWCFPNLNRVFFVPGPKQEHKHSIARKTK